MGNQSFQTTFFKSTHALDKPNLVAWALPTRFAVCQSESDSCPRIYFAGRTRATICFDGILSISCSD